MEIEPEQPNTSNLKIEPQKDVSASSYYTNFYNMFLRDSNGKVNLDMDTVLSDYKKSIYENPPPTNCSQRISDMYRYLDEINKESIEELALLLEKMPENTIYETIQNIEKLYAKLNIDFENERKKGVLLNLMKEEQQFIHNLTCNQAF